MHGAWVARDPDKAIVCPGYGVVLERFEFQHCLGTVRIDNPPHGLLRQRILEIYERIKAEHYFDRNGVSVVCREPYAALNETGRNAYGRGFRASGTLKTFNDLLFRWRPVGEYPAAVLVLVLVHRLREAAAADCEQRRDNNQSIVLIQYSLGPNHPRYGESRKLASTDCPVSGL